MRFPLRLNYDLTRYIIRNKFSKTTRYPLVLMLEPTHLCNLACSGCGRIREYADTIQAMMSLEECLASVDECPAPVVTITGGEPFLYPHLNELVTAVLERGKHIYFCTNGHMTRSSSVSRCKNAPVVFAIDRAGVVGEDGATHQGVCSISRTCAISRA